MAAISNVVKSRHVTLTAGQVDTVTFTTNYSKAAVTMRSPASGSAGLWVTNDGATDPTTAGNDTDWVPPVAGAEIVIDLPSTDALRIFSATADGYTVRGVN